MTESESREQVLATLSSLSPARAMSSKANGKPSSVGAVVISACTYLSDISRFAKLNQSTQVSRVNVCKVELDPVVV